MMENDGISLKIAVDAKSLNAALAKIEGSTNVISNNIEIGFQSLDVRIGQLAEEFVKFERVAAKTGTLFTNILETAGSIDPPLSGLALLGKELRDSATDAKSLDAEFNRLLKARPTALLAEFEELQSRIGSLRAARAAGLTGIDINPVVSTIMASQERIVEAIKERTRILEDLIDSNIAP